MRSDVWGVLPMKSLCLAIFLLFGLLSAVLLTPAQAGFKDGMVAHQRGDYDRALKEFRAGAAKGEGLAIFSLGFMYFKGQGVARNPAQAHMWFDLAAAQFPPGANRNRARINRDKMAKELNAQQMAISQRTARLWLERFARETMPAAGGR